MYFLSFLIFSVLVVNAIAVNDTKGIELWKNFTQSAENLCACSKFPLDLELKCEHDEEAFHDKNSTTYIEKICENMNRTLDSGTPATEHTETPFEEQNTTPTYYMNSTTPATEYTETTPEVQNNTHVVVKENYLGCYCFTDGNYTPGRTTNTLNCTISKKTIDEDDPPPAIVEKLNSFCQNLTWASLPPPPPPNDTSISTDSGKKDEKHRLKGDSMAHALKSLCACSTISMGALTMPCEDEDIWLSLNSKIRTKLDDFCKLALKLNTKPATATEPTSKTAPEKPSPHSAAEDTPARQYTLGKVLVLGFAAFACGTLLAIAAKISHTRYKRKHPRNEPMVI